MANSAVLDEEQAQFEAIQRQRDFMQNRVRRDTVVAELAEEDQPGLEKFKSDTLVGCVGELSVCGMAYYMISTGPQPEQVSSYLTEFVFALGPFALLKIVLFYCTAGSRSLAKSEWWKLIVMLLQGVAIFVVWVRGLTTYGDMTLVVQENERLAPREMDIRVQNYLWGAPAGYDQPFVYNAIGIISVLVILYYLILFFAAIILTIFIGVSICLLSNSNQDDFSDANTEEQRQENTSALSKLQRVFDWNKYSEHEECVICLLAFKDTDTVTPLPCDKRHYFHSGCIEEWSKSHSECPLCKAPFDNASIERALATRSSITLPPEKVAAHQTYGVDGALDVMAPSDQTYSGLDGRRQTYKIEDP